MSHVGRQQRSPRRGLGACAAAAALSAAFPGAGHLAARLRVRGVVATAVAVNAVAVGWLTMMAVRRPAGGLTALVAEPNALAMIGMGLTALAITRLVCIVDAAWQTRPVGRSLRTVLAGAASAAMALATAVPLMVAGEAVRAVDRAADEVLADAPAPVAMPSPIAPGIVSPSAGEEGPTGSSPVDSSVPITVSPGGAPAVVPEAPPTTLPPIVGVNRINILLLGGDAGPGRWSLRTDSMIVVSIDPMTGDTAMVSVPRNLQRLPFPDGTALHDRYPNGFTDLANAVYPIVNQRRELVDGRDDAAAQAIKLGIAQLLGMPIHFYVLVDMAGFVDVIDALGGIDIDVRKAVPAPGNPPGAKHDVPAVIEAGPQHMDGTLALAYARSRSADSDYQRMGRQRCVLSALTAAATPRAVVGGFAELLDAVGSSIETDIPRDRLGEIGELLRRFAWAGGLGNVRALSLAPPVINPARWDPTTVRLLVAETLTAPATAVPLPPLPPLPPVPPAPGPVPTSPDTGPDGGTVPAGTPVVIGEQIGGC